MSQASDLLDVLLDQIEAGNPAFVTDLQTKALAQITAGNGELPILTTGTVNGKAFGRTVPLTAVQVARQCAEALREAAGYGPITNIDFSRSLPDGMGDRGDEESWP